MQHYVNYYLQRQNFKCQIILNTWEDILSHFFEIQKINSVITLTVSFTNVEGAELFYISKAGSKWTKIYD